MQCSPDPMILFIGMMVFSSIFLPSGKDFSGNSAGENMFLKRNTENMFLFFIFQIIGRNFISFIIIYLQCISLEGIFHLKNLQGLV